jgi:RNA polymerase subunit RPABC4/transcription elongation factor Spt4
MGKTHRGKGIRELFARGRGTCPVCGATGIKVLYEQDAGGQKVKVCKPCKAAIKHGKKSVPTVQAAVAAE